MRIERYLGNSLEVVGIVDPSVERVTQVLAQKKVSEAAPCYTHTRHFTSVDEAATKLKSTGIVPKLIILVAPPHFRGTILEGRNLEVKVISAFGSAPAIFCEKPVSTERPPQSLPIVHLLRQSGNLVSVGYMLRYLKIVQKAKSVIQKNDLQVMAVNARYTFAYSKTRKIDWWNKSKQCGPIVEQATHFCDLCRYLGGEVRLDSVKALALEHDEPAGKLSYMSVDESQIPEEEKIPRATTAFWQVPCKLLSCTLLTGLRKFQNGALGSLTHIIALHGMRYSNEIVVTADGYQLRLVDLYTTPTLYVRLVSSAPTKKEIVKEDCLFYLLLFRTPASEKEEIFTYPDDDPFYSEFAAILHTIGATSVSDQVNQQNDVKENAASEDEASLAPTTTLSTYMDAWKTYEFTWRIRDESEKPAEE